MSAKVIDVRGQLHNTIISEKNLIVRSTGKIAGKVHYSEIEIEKGGEIEGSLSQDIEEMQAPNNNINNNVGAFQRQTQPQQMPSQTQVQNQAQSPRSFAKPKDFDCKCSNAECPKHKWYQPKSSWHEQSSSSGLSLFKSYG